MTLIELQKLRIISKKEGNNEKSNIIMMIIDYSQKLAKEDNNEVNEKYIQKGLKKYIKQVEDSIKNGIESAKKEMEILKEFSEKILPKELNSNDLENLIKDIIKKVGNNFGNIMKELKLIEGVNMKKASEIVKNLLKNDKI
jgi:uncharacterized protein YqeY